MTAQKQDRISTRNLRPLPGISALQDVCLSIAMLDAILCPEWEERRYSYNHNFAPRRSMASMRDGSGDDYAILFDPLGAIIKGYAHESAMAAHCILQNAPYPGVVSSLPNEFADILTDPAFDASFTTFCIWRTAGDTEWRCGAIDFPPEKDPDGSAALLFILDGEPGTYKRWADEYFEVADGSQGVPLAAIKQIYRREPLTTDLVNMLNPTRSLAALLPDIEEIGYPN